MTSSSPLAFAGRLAVAKPLYAQVRDLLLGRVKKGEWSAGETLPNEFVLSKEFDVSIGTVRRAVAELEAGGVLVRKQGRGTYVAAAGPAGLQTKFSKLRTPAGERMAVRFVLAGISSRPGRGPEITSLSLPEGAAVFEVVQIAEHATRKIGVEVSVVPASMFPRLETQVRFGQHLYPVLADYGSIVTRVDETIGIEAADAFAAGHLSVETGAALLAVESVAIALDGRRIELRTARYLPGLVRFCAAPTSA